ncbi:MAG: response regulator [Thermoguttaceae bacterium]|jgi:CheY-like chemotaxis protein|nr:response regulator [Thermoguttaceae bacterium]
MITIASILLAEGGTPFLESTASCLREDGYSCDTVTDAAEALKLFSSRQYQLLISDLRLNGTSGLELVKQANRMVPGVPAILVAESPSLATAVEAVELPVAAYLPKSVPYEELLGKVQATLDKTAHCRDLARVHRQLLHCAAELDELRSHRCQVAMRDGSPTLRIPLSTLRGVAGCLSELVAMETRSDADGRVVRVCELLQCPVWRIHRNAIGKAVGLLNETKRRFKSKELAQVREMLENLLETLH